MNRRPLTSDDIGRLHDLARERAMQLRREAMDDWFARAAAALRRLRLRRDPALTLRLEA